FVAVSRFVFFFQAEDGIRVFHVTGVQTCALPICPACSTATRSAQLSRSSTSCDETSTLQLLSGAASSNPSVNSCRASGSRPLNRSEERRVGKECRSRWSTEHETIKRG